MTHSPITHPPITLTHRELLEAAVILLTLDEGLPAAVDRSWFAWPPAAGAWERLVAAQRLRATVTLIDLIATPETTEVTDALPQVMHYIGSLDRAVEGLRVYVDREWLTTLCTTTLRELPGVTETGPLLTRIAQAITGRLDGHGAEDIVSARMAAIAVYAGMQTRQQQPETTGLAFGWASWDALTMGLLPGDCVIVAARTGVGKTVVAANLTRHWVRRGHAVHYISLEMRATRLMARWLAMETDLQSQTFARGTLHSAVDWKTASDAVAVISEWPLTISQVAPLTLNAACQQIREQARKRPLAAAVLDYAGLLEVQAQHRGEANAYIIGRIPRALKNLAMELEIPLVVLVQLSRAIDGRGPGAVPTLADLRDTGEWEQTGDMIWMLYRNPADPHAIQALLAKNRDGEANITVPMGWTESTGLLVDRGRSA